MPTVASLDRDQGSETWQGSRRRPSKRASARDLEARLRALRAILAEARGRAIRPRRAS
jgi:uncharacterized protein (DUF2126 family)